MYGSGCFPLGLPDQLGFLLGLIDNGVGDGDVVVPGHGPVVDRAFVEAQRVEAEALAERIRSAWRRGDTVGQALADPGRWPFPVEGLELAVRRGYRTLEAEGSAGRASPRTRDSSTERADRGR